MGKCLFPAAGLFEMASAAGSALALPSTNAQVLINASITAPCSISVTAQQQPLVCAMEFRYDALSDSYASAADLCSPGMMHSPSGVDPAGRVLWR